MGEAKRRKAGGSKFTTRTCPCCNVRKIVLHIVRHGGEIRTANNEPVCYPFNGDQGHLVADFGVLQVESTLSDASLSVRAFGNLVLAMWPPSGPGGDIAVKILHDGQWIGVLGSIVAMLDQRYGPVNIDASGPGSHALH